MNNLRHVREYKHFRILFIPVNLKGHHTVHQLFLIIQCIKVMNGITTAATAYYRTILITPTSVRCIDFSIKSFGSLREEIIQNLVKQID